MMWEALELGAEGVDETGMRAERYQLKQDKIADAQERGVVRPDLPPPALLMLLMGLINYPDVMPQVGKLVFGNELDQEDLRAWTKVAVRRIAAPTS
ncbi:hypothetical protein [Nocardia sp. AG03]|uniref:hypothetical protein n=1 Tax=Nocardia sp. AG03 TaxID=3025312 RepID=UPI002418981E|nr:hypothetical protein [Nocardia sp. AG03]